ncbi:MAG TPA: flagellar hook protein FlgE [Alphaproteobacteria bacterium]|nr:flagellar hook protein FlgE [Alphaproteobacteria bacterium]
MSLFGAMFSSVSGLTAQSQALGTVSDNIANAETVGYKSVGNSFSTLVADPMSATNYTPGGVISHPFQTVTAQGLIQGSSTPTNLAISGSGFFVVSATATPSTTAPDLFTRAGDFAPDAKGNLVNSAGFFLQGYPTDANGNVTNPSFTTTAGLQTININGLSGTAAATQNLSLNANLPATAATGTNETVTAQVYDSLGVAHNLVIEFTKTATANQWTMSIPSMTVAATGASSAASVSIVPAADATVTFNTDGTFASPTGATIQVTGFTTGAANDTINLNLGTAGQANGLTQYASSFQLGAGGIQQDGRTFGSLTSVSIGKDGLVTATFSNGQTRPFAKVPLATFTNPDGLLAQTGNVYSATANSGPLLLQYAQTGNAGLIDSGSLEQSTVDLAAQFSTMIVTQQAYSASAKVFNTADQMMQVLNNIGGQA